MQTRFQPVSTKQQMAVALAVCCGLVIANAAFAGADTTFASSVKTITGWLGGSMGQLFAIGALAVGLGVGIVKQSIMSVVVGVGIALAVTTGPTALTSIITMTV